MIAKTSSNMRKLTPHAYKQIIQRLREEVCRTVPAESTVIVVSKGDEELLNLGVRRAWHFPRYKA